MRNRTLYLRWTLTERLYLWLGGRPYWRRSHAWAEAEDCTPLAEWRSRGRRAA